MTPSATVSADSYAPPSNNGDATKSRNTEPLKKSGVLEAAFGFEDITPTIGREITAQIVEDILNAPNADDLLRDLAITISERGVVFFRKQDSLTNELQKKFILRLGELTGRPTSSTVHIHPIINNTSPHSKSDGDAEISTITSHYRKERAAKTARPTLRKNLRTSEANWHSDVQYEVVPADYTSLRIIQLPKNGGDTLWASGYDVYDRFSKPYQKMFDSLTVTYSGEGFIKAAEETKAVIYDQPRGSPENVGKHLIAVHPLVRTNPVTGWKSLFAIGNFPKYINELDPEESADLLQKFYQTILDNHDLQVRFKWKNQNDIAIWDNRSVFHSATFDYDGLGDRAGNRVVGIGEKPYFDPNSLSKAEALAASADASA
ncbi:hypothetical protein EG328_001716 [Venturia inaequalis]|uniref:TauD/TfdA-like domain-containing protein n=1 Tax=Venturia inaequalis TaxID=5025 RepID=A0A8H3Z274_VENIN|nr:hypothetical protein EG328_001716 [Venturia inaequalis]